MLVNCFKKREENKKKKNATDLMTNLFQDEENDVNPNMVSNDQFHHQMFSTTIY